MTSFEEIREVLQQYKSHLEQVNKKLELICVDDCCKVWNKYESVFERTPIKLDLYHISVRQLLISTILLRDLLGRNLDCSLHMATIKEK